MPRRIRRQTSAEAQEKTASVSAAVRCAVYTRKSHEDGLEQEFNSLDAQREAGEAYIASQKSQGWELISEHYDDGGFSGGTMERPALKRLLADVDAGRIDVIVVYKIDRLSRSLLDFITMVERFNELHVSFVAVTQQINTTDSAGRMMMNILMTFAQYEREITADRIRDKVAAAKRKGKHCGGIPPFGYDLDTAAHKLLVNEKEAEHVRWIFQRYIQTASVKTVCRELNERGIATKSWTTLKGIKRESGKWNTAKLYRMFANYVYVGKVYHKGDVYEGEHEAVIDMATWDQAHMMLNAQNPLELRSDARTETMYLLKGVIRCGCCNSAMTPTASYCGKKGKKYAYYLCNKDSKRGVSTCPIRRLSAPIVEDVVMKQIKRVLLCPTIIQETLKSVRMEDKLTSGSIIASSFQNMDTFWNELFPIERNRIIRLLISSVTVWEDRIDIEFNTKGMKGVAEELMATEDAANG